MILPTLAGEQCIGCGECVAACPTDCLAMCGPLPWLPRPGDCVQCAACELICPVDAIRLRANPLDFPPLSLKLNDAKT